MARQIKQENNYQSRLLKLIPSEIIAAYLVIVGFIPPGYEHSKILLTVITAVLLVMIPFYLINFQSVKGVFQIIFTSFSFLVWVYSMGGPFIYFGLHEPVAGSTLLVLWTLLVPFVVKPENL
ncbi:MAG TPA: hypothetical protein DEQ09_02855 [Bacteroidales bacterium]|nr:hypothetical protein [Bacteroidales bacterium]